MMPSQLSTSPTSLRFTAARELFRAGVDEYSRGKRLSEKACALIGQAMLREPRAVAFMEFFLLLHEDNEQKGGAFVPLGPLIEGFHEPVVDGASETVDSTIASLHAAVVVAYCARAFVQMVRRSGLADRDEAAVGAGLKHCDDLDRRACLCATKLCPSDPRVWRLLASSYARSGEDEPAAEALARAIEAGRALPEADPRSEDWYAALFSLGALNDSLAGPSLIEKRRLVEQSIALINEFLDLAPPCHLFVPDACFWLSNTAVLARADSLGSSAADIAARFPEDTALSAALFARGQQALGLQRRLFPPRPASQYETEAHSLQSQFLKCGAVATVPRVPQQCSALGCAGYGLSSCARCRVAAYCGPTCQKAHWREHKAACTALRDEREREEAAAAPVGGAIPPVADRGDAQGAAPIAALA